MILATDLAGGGSGRGGVVSEDRDRDRPRLAEIVRLDRAHPRPVAGDSPEADAVKLAARAHQTLIWDRAWRGDAAARATQIQQLLRAPRLAQPPPVQATCSAIVTAQVALITSLNEQIASLGEVVAAHFGLHPDADIYTGQPGPGCHPRRPGPGRVR